MTTIPRKIRVGDKWYSVEVVEAMRERRRAAYVHYGNRKITVARTSNISGKMFAPREMNEAFWHELTHAILEDMHHPLRGSERFVTEFAKRLSQAIESAGEEQE